MPFRPPVRTLLAFATLTSLGLSLAGLASRPFVTARTDAASAPVYAKNHRYLMVSGFGTPLISSVRVDRDGHMSLVPGSPTTTSVAPLALVITPDGQTVYSTGTGSGTIKVFHVGIDGVLTPRDADTVIVGSPVVGATITPDGSRLFITTGPSAQSGAVATVRSYRIAASGELSPTSAPAVAVSSPLSQIATTPNGRDLVVSNYLTSTVVSFAIGKGSKLSQVGAPLGTGSQPVMPAITPNGRYVYISNEESGNLSGYSIAASGQLAPIPGSPFKAGTEPHGAVISPNGRRLYVPDSTGSAILGYRIGAEGRLARLPGSPYPTPGLAGRLLLSPDGHHLFAVQAIATDNPQLHSYITSYVLNSKGQPVRDANPPVDTGIVFEDGSTAYLTPDQGPVAALRLVRSRGTARTFSAAGSFDPDGHVRSFAWSFGDGAHRTTSLPVVTHVYPRRGPYAVRVTVVDDEGCSSSLIYEGTTVLCRGSAAARSVLHLRR